MISINKNTDTVTWKQLSSAKIKTPKLKIQIDSMPKKLQAL